MLKDIKSGIIIAFTFLTVVWLAGVTYAAWVNMTDVNTGETLTASTFNVVQENVRVLKAAVWTKKTVCTKFDAWYVNTNNANNSYYWQASDCSNWLPSWTCVSMISSASANWGDQDWRAFNPWESWFTNWWISYWLTSSANGLWARVVYFCD